MTVEMTAEMEKLEKIEAENKVLRMKLEEAEASIQAIRNGEVDAVVVTGPEGEKIYTLSGAEHIYRILVEAINEGAVVLSPDGIIVYCNRSFASILGRPIYQVIGHSFYEFVTGANVNLIKTMIDQAELHSSQKEINLNSINFGSVPVLVSVGNFKGCDEPTVHMVVTDLTEYKRTEIELKKYHEHLEDLVIERTKELSLVNESILKSERRIISILESINEMFIAIDRDWRCTYVNIMARNFFNVATENDGRELIGMFIWDAIPDIMETVIFEKFTTAMIKRIHIVFDIFYSPMNKWYRINIYPIEDGISVYWQDINDQHALDEAQKQLLKSGLEKTEALQRAIEMKDEFLSLISHEFKTPLTVIISAIQAMEHICRKELSDKAKGYLRKILQNANRQLKLVNNLLDVTRVNAGHLKINNKNMDIVQLTDSITYSIKVFADQKGIKLAFSSTLQKKVIGIDDEKYERILLNLLSNAIKFTPQGKSITVKVSQKIVKRKCKVCIEVRDKGVGIPNDKKGLIFERFGQVDSSLTRQAEGTGIGLSLVKMLVELLGGEITLDSKVGKGSTFTILLPIEKAKETPIEQMIKEINDNRLIQAINIEFSDIYI
jgi:PAS domain S-box-containing protein